MGNRSFFYGSDAELYTGSANFSTKIGSKGSQYGITPQQATDYATANAVYAAKYEAAIDPETRTKGKIAAKNAAKASLKLMASDLAKFVDGTPSVTDEMKIDLGLAVRKQPSPQPAPTERPAVNIVSVVGRTVTIRIRDTAESSKRGKPAGVLGASVYSYVGTTYPTDPTAWSFDGTTTKTTHAIVFPDTVANGAQIWVCATWFNRKTETGPISIPVTTNVQGGLGVSVQAALKMAA